MSRPSQPAPRRGWTADDHARNARLIQRDRDERLAEAVAERIGRWIGVRGRVLAAAFGRLLDDRINAALQTLQPTLQQQFADEPNQPALREAVFGLILDDLIEFQAQFTRKDAKNERRTKGKD